MQQAIATGSHVVYKNLSHVESDSHREVEITPLTAEVPSRTSDQTLKSMSVKPAFTSEPLLSCQENQQSKKQTEKKSSKEISRTVPTDEIDTLFKDLTLRETAKDRCLIRVLTCCYGCGIKTPDAQWLDILKQALIEFNKKSDQNWSFQRPYMEKILQFHLFVLWLHYDHYSTISSDDRIKRDFETLADHTLTLFSRCYLIGGEKAICNVLSVEKMPSKAFSMFPRISSTDEYSSIPSRLKKHLSKNNKSNYPEFIFKLREVIHDPERAGKILGLSPDEINYCSLRSAQLKHPSLFMQGPTPDLERIAGKAGFKNLGNTCYANASVVTLFSCYFPEVHDDSETALPLPLSAQTDEPTHFPPIRESLQALYRQFSGQPNEDMQERYTELLDSLITAAKAHRDGFSGIHSVRKNQSAQWTPKTLPQEDQAEFLQALLDQVLRLNQVPEYRFFTWEERTIKKDGVTVKTALKDTEAEPWTMLTIDVPASSSSTLQALIDDNFKAIPVSGKTTFCTREDLDYTAYTSAEGISEITLMDHEDSGWEIQTTCKKLMADTMKLRSITLNFAVPDTYDGRQQFKDAVLRTPHKVVYLPFVDRITKQEAKLPFEIISSTYYEQHLPTGSTAEDAAWGHQGHYLAVVDSDVGGLLYDNEAVYIHNTPDQPYRLDHHYGRGVPVTIGLKRISEESAQRIICQSHQTDRLDASQRSSDEAVEAEAMEIALFDDTSHQSARKWRAKALDVETKRFAEEKQSLI